MCNRLSWLLGSKLYIYHTVLDLLVLCIVNLLFYVLNVFTVSLFNYYWLFVNSVWYLVGHFSTDGCINKSLTYLLTYLVCNDSACLTRQLKAICHFSRSYCYTALASCVSSVRLSIRLSVMLCIVAPGSVYWTKRCTNVFLAGKFLFLSSDTFAVGCIV